MDSVAFWLAALGVLLLVWIAGVGMWMTVDMLVLEWRAERARSRQRAPRD